ncbi:hypothetical protein EJ08DRAFT_651132 [Tothia fuscella]|uniref:Uncharacterized protein n=1 Tax=Tothia fuscella TaxID=1048955 RepID=A0A9P4NNC1_9PEZI|nr:hypothetical protein EJ08DRAFT_651132 [Tothia fuscella]
MFWLLWSSYGNSTLVCLSWATTTIGLRSLLKVHIEQIKFMWWHIGLLRRVGCIELEGHLFKGHFVGGSFPDVGV